MVHEVLFTMTNVGTFCVRNFRSVCSAQCGCFLWFLDLVFSRNVAQVVYCYSYCHNHPVSLWLSSLADSQKNMGLTDQALAYSLFCQKLSNCMDVCSISERLKNTSCCFLHENILSRVDVKQCHNFI